MERMREKIEAQLRQFDLQVVRPQQKVAFQCSAKCCDAKSGEQEFAQCLQSCSTTVQALEHSVQAEVNQLQQRLGRCVAVCQDKAQALMADKQDSVKAQALLDSCAADCAAATEAEAPKVFARLSKKHG